MWFKTRVGFVSVTEPSEILVAKNTKKCTWCIYVSLKAMPEITTKSVLKGSSTIRNPSSILANFSDGPAVSKAIAECMARIEDSIRTKAEFCDLSQSGDPEAWAKVGGWQQIHWLNDKPAV
jgi:hypothetical protein